MDLDDILRRIRDGDRQAFAEIVRRYQRPLFGFLGNMGLPYGRVEELAQETFLRAWGSLGRYRPELGSFASWLFAIARNLALNEIARPASRLETAPPDDLPEPPCDRPPPSESIEHDQRRRALHAALGRLPAPDRCVLALAYLREMDLAEIARIENCTVGAVKTRLHRARNKLARLLESDDA